MNKNMILISSIILTALLLCVVVIYGLNAEKEVDVASPVEEKIMVKVFFGNIVNDPNVMDCDVVYPVEREVMKTPAVARAALEELFKGPTKDEINQSFFTSINEGVTIQKLGIVDGVAMVELSKKLEEAVGGSCRTAAIRAQITQTLKQFPTIKDVIISIDGRTEDILQP